MVAHQRCLPGTAHKSCSHVGEGRCCTPCANDARTGDLVQSPPHWFLRTAWTSHEQFVCRVYCNIAYCCYWGHYPEVFVDSTSNPSNGCCPEKKGETKTPKRYVCIYIYMHVHTTTTMVCCNKVCVQSKKHSQRAASSRSFERRRCTSWLPSITKGSDFLPSMTQLKVIGNSSQGSPKNTHLRTSYPPNGQRSNKQIYCWSSLTATCRAELRPLGFYISILYDSITLWPHPPLCRSWGPEGFAERSTLPANRPSMETSWPWKRCTHWVLKFLP